MYHKVYLVIMLKFEYDLSEVEFACDAFWAKSAQITEEHKIVATVLLGHC